ncbi:MAG: TPM domain-containing protein, partial [Selenomonadaceae bacterium]|nr:TPM domain-containing protein [Selenomonadaceae bacterium]
MIKKIYLSIVLLIALTGAALAAASIPPAPAHDIYVSDFASMLNDADKNQIIELGRELDQKHGAQIVVVTLDTLDGADIDQYANELFRAWGIGDRKKNNGVLLLIAKEDHKFRIE